MKKENTPTIETERLILRQFIYSDIEDIFLIYSDEEVNRFLPWFPLKSIEESEYYLKNNIFEEYKKEIAYRYAIIYKDTNRAIGYISINDINEKKCSGDLGYGLKKEYWNKGIITEAGTHLLKKLKENGFMFITATHDVNNLGSGRVMEKLNMKYQYSYEELWQPKNFKVTFKLYKIDF